MVAVVFFFGVKVEGANFPSSRKVRVVQNLSESASMKTIFENEHADLFPNVFIPLLYSK